MAPSGGTNVLSDDQMVWTKEETKDQIKRLENQLSVAIKQHAEGNAVADVQTKIEKANDLFSKDQDFLQTQDLLIDAKNELSGVINKLSGWRKFAYFASIWGVVPASYAVGVGLVASFIALAYFGDRTILGVVPFWACWIAVIGAAVQIVVGVVKDYKDDGMITDYKRLWYLCLLPVSFGLGFIAFFLVQGGLITITQGQFIINPNLNMTATSGLANQTATTGTVSQATTYGLALPFVLCFLAGYATDWFLAQLGKLTPAAPATGSETGASARS